MKRTLRASPPSSGLALSAGVGAAEKRRIEISDLHRIVRVSDPRIAPDGKSIVCVVSRANVDGQPLGERDRLGRRRDRAPRAR